MNRKSDYIIFAALVALLLAWPTLDRIIHKQYFGGSDILSTTNVMEQADLTDPPDQTDLPDPSEPAVTPEATAVEAVELKSAEITDEPESTRVLSNERMQLTFSSRGAALREATLLGYRSQLAKDSGPVVLDFSDAYAMAYADLPGFGPETSFTISSEARGSALRFERRLRNGVKLERLVELSTNYVLQVTDTFVNGGEQAAALPDHAIRTGPMRNEPGHSDQIGFVTLGVDTWSPSEGVRHVGKEVPGLFKVDREDRGLPGLPLSIDRTANENPIDWAAAKNKYFVQILTPILPEEGAAGCGVIATRQEVPGERANPASVKKMTPISSIAATVLFPALDLAPGESFVRKFQYYVGPKKYAELHAIGLHQVDVMELGDWVRPIATMLLKTLNFIHDHLWANYGVAIMLLTIIIKLVFWPVTHKSTESMKRMMEVQPLVKAIQEKHKNNPQKMQQEVMAVYKEHKVNPLGGCLPMLIQIPIFVSLFYVLRSAIELRYAPFLWIHDLSEPENLFADTLPFALNILPLLMALTMYFQQKLTPSGGDPAQAKMMRIMMPIMMLFFLYSYASGLALYWTTQNVLMIVQQLVTLRSQKKAKTA